MDRNALILDDSSWPFSGTALLSAMLAPFLVLRAQVQLSDKPEKKYETRYRNQLKWADNHCQHPKIFFRFDEQAQWI